MNIWWISTTAHFDKMRTAFPCLLAEVTNYSVFSKQPEIVSLVSLCIWFAFYSMLSFFSSQGHFCVSYLLMLSEVAAGKLREDFTEWRRENFAGFTVETPQSTAICQSLHYSLLWKFFKQRWRKIHYFISLSSVRGTLTHINPQHL